MRPKSSGGMRLIDCAPYGSINGFGVLDEWRRREAPLAIQQYPKPQTEGILEQNLVHRVVLNVNAFVTASHDAHIRVSGGGGDQAKDGLGQVPKRRCKSGQAWIERSSSGSAFNPSGPISSPRTRAAMPSTRT